MIWVIALPSRLDNRIRRKPFPIVTPKPRSNGSAMNFPYIGVNDFVSTINELGNSNPAPTNVHAVNSAE
ncbi:MAG: hypothetical protein QM811_00260 [Pirellulales bacterium]